MRDIVRKRLHIETGTSKAALSSLSALSLRGKRSEGGKAAGARVSEHRFVSGHRNFPGP
jgi:hypothetical protein